MCSSDLLVAACAANQSPPPSPCANPAQISELASRAALRLGAYSRKLITKGDLEQELGSSLSAHSGLVRGCQDAFRAALNEELRRVESLSRTEVQRQLRE